MIEFLQFLKANFGIVVASLFALGGGGAAIAYAIFKRFGEKWLDVKFESQLADYRHRQQLEVEGLKYKITALVDRRTKLNQRELEILPEAWGRLNEAFLHTRAAVIRFHQFPDFSQMSEDRFERVLSEMDMKEAAKFEFKSVPQSQRNKFYTRHISWRQIGAAREKLQEYQLYIMKNSIFIPREIIVELNAFCGMLNSALVDAEFAVEGHGVERSDETRKLIGADGDTLLNDLEAAIYARLWDALEASVPQ